MRRNKKKSRQLALLLILLGITVGFALLSTTLKINGTAGIKSSQWDIHWENVQVNNESTVTTEEPAITENRTKVTYEVNLELPGDFYEFTVDAKNDGSINGKITDIKHNVYLSTDTEHENPVTLPSYILYTLYYDGTTTPPAPDDILEAGEKQTYRVRVEYDSEATTIPSTDTTYVVVDEITYTQTKDSDTPPEPEDTSIPGLWFYQINNDGEHTASVIALNYAYDAEMIAFDEFGTSDFIDSFDEWQGPTIPAYIKDVVAPRKVKLDANGHYDPNGTEYTVTRFYDDPYDVTLTSAEEDYLDDHNGRGFNQTTNLVGTLTFPDTYTTIELNGEGYNLLDVLTVSDNLTTIDDLNMYMFEDYTERGPKIEFTVPSHVTSLGENSICSVRLKSVRVPSTVTTIATDACCDYNGTVYYAADATTKSRMEAAGCTNVQLTQ